MPHPLGTSLEALRQAGHWKRVSACLANGHLQKEPKSLGIKAEDVVVAHAVDTSLACRVTARWTRTPCCPAPLEDSWVRNQQLFSVPPKESHKFSLNSAWFPLLSHGPHPLRPPKPSDSFAFNRARTWSQDITQGGTEHLKILA